MCDYSFKKIFSKLSAISVVIGIIALATSLGVNYVDSKFDSYLLEVKDTAVCIKSDGKAVCNYSSDIVNLSNGSTIKDYRFTIDNDFKVKYTYYSKGIDYKEGVEYDCIIYKFRYSEKSSYGIDVLVIGDGTTSLDGNCFDLMNNKDIYLKDVANACIRSEKVTCVCIGGILVFGIVLVCLLIFKNELYKKENSVEKE